MLELLLKNASVGKVFMTVGTGTNMTAPPRIVMNGMGILYKYLEMVP